MAFSERENTNLRKPTIHCGYIGEYEIYKCVYSYVEDGTRHEFAYIVLRNNRYRYEWDIDIRMDIEEIRAKCRRFLERYGGAPAREFDPDLPGVWWE